MTPTDRKEQILDAAQPLLQRLGYTTFSYQHLADVLSIKKPSIHHHFPTKEALGLALIERFHGMLDQLLAHVGTAPTAGAEFRAFLSMGEEMCESEPHHVCPLGALQTDFESFPESMQRETQRLTERMHTFLADILGRARTAGEMHFPGTSEAQAWLVMSALQGARQNGRAAGPEVWRVVFTQVAASVFITPAT